MVTMVEVDASSSTGAPDLANHRDEYSLQDGTAHTALETPTASIESTTEALCTPAVAQASKTEPGKAVTLHSRDADSEEPSSDTEVDDPSTAKRPRKGFSDRIKELQRYKKRHGDCMVPHKYKHNPSLGTWVDTQRRQYRLYLRQHHQNSASTRGGINKYKKKSLSSLTAEKIVELESIGFVFEPRPSRAETWVRRVEELRSFRVKNGHCLVREDDSRFPGLGKWVSYVRRQYRLQQKGVRKSPSESNRLSTERLRELQELGFVFELREVQAQSRFRSAIEELKKFHAEEGHTNVPPFYKKNPMLGLVVEELRVEFDKKILGGVNERSSSALTSDMLEELMGLGWMKPPLTAQPKPIRRSSDPTDPDVGAEGSKLLVAEKKKFVNV